MQRDLSKFQTENVELAAKVGLGAGRAVMGGAYQRRNITVKPYNEQETSSKWGDSIVTVKLEMMLGDLEG